MLTEKILCTAHALVIIDSFIILFALVLFFFTFPYIFYAGYFRLGLPHGHKS